MSRINRKERSNGFFYEFYLLFLKNTLKYGRNKEAILGRLITPIWTAIYISILFHEKSYTEFGSSDIRGLIYIFTIVIVLYTITSQLSIFIAEKQVFLKERASNLYSVASYFCAKTATEYSFLFAYVFLFVMIVYYSAGLNDIHGYKFFQTLFVCYLSALTGTAFANFIGASITKQETLNLILPVCTIPLLLSSGFYGRASAITFIMYPFKFISIFKHLFQTCLTITFSDNRVYYCQNGDVENGEEGCDLLARENFDEPFWVSILIMCCIFVFCNLIAYFKMHQFSKLKV